MKRYSIEQLLIALLLFCGIFLSSIQYLYNRSLWMDEAMLARNIIHKNHAELLRPLEDHQMAPVLFLQIEKTFSQVTHGNEYGLRLLPLISYWSAIFFFYRLITILHSNFYIRVFCLSLFIFNVRLLFFSSEVKQYMIDVTVLTAIYFLLLKEYQQKQNRYMALGAAGVIGIFLSNVTPIILFTAGIFLVYDQVRKTTKDLPQLTALFTLWTVSFACYYFFFIHNHPARNFMTSYWQKENAFFPMNPISAESFKFISMKTVIVSSQLWSYRNFGVFLMAPLLAAGMLQICLKKKADILILTLVPLSLHLIVSGLRLYPLHTRFLLYAIPLMILICSYSFHWIDPFLNTISRRQLGIAAIGTCLIIVVLFCQNNFPIQKEEIKQSIQFIDRNKILGDRLYIYWGAIPALKYYREIKVMNLDLPVVLGNPHLENRIQYIQELNELRGTFWLLFSHPYRDEEKYIVSTLDSLGFRRLETFKTVKSSAYHYSFMKPMRQRG